MSRHYPERCSFVDAINVARAGGFPTEYQGRMLHAAVKVLSIPVATTLATQRSQAPCSGEFEARR